MELTNDFIVNAPFDRAWAVLTDVERIAPCMPGAQLKEVRGDEFLGTVKVKVGPITAEYQGTASWGERDVDAGRVVLRAQGRETRGQGNASATVTATLQADGMATKVSVVTDLSITGKVAQFGRGVLVDVSTKLLGQFVVALEADVLADDPAIDDPGSAPEVDEVTAPASKPPVSRIVESAEAEPIDLLELAGNSMAKRAIPAVVGAFVALTFWRRLRRRRSRRSSR